MKTKKRVKNNQRQQIVHQYCGVKTGYGRRTCGRRICGLDENNVKEIFKKDFLK